METTVDVSPHLLAVLVLLGRAGDVLSTRLVTPTLALEANPVARRFGWRFAWATLLLCFVPYVSPAMGIMLFVASFFVTGSNLSRAWAIRALGEREYLDFLIRVARRAPASVGVGFVLAAALAFAIPGVVLCFSGEGAFARWFGFGVIAYAFAMALHGSLAIRRIARLRPAAA